MKTPLGILEKFESASEELYFGDVILRLSIKQGKSRYVIIRKESVIAKKEPPTQEENE
ncbi:MAG: hypothetical protein LBH43_07745 [Treponema sp.]|jgi:hypothetical protein|nr:hypothetical protein [Treponema sp.]